MTRLHRTSFDALADEREPVLYERHHRRPGSFAGLLLAVSTVAEAEPDETFVDEDVVIRAEILVQLLVERIRSAPPEFERPMM